MRTQRHRFINDAYPQFEFIMSIHVCFCINIYKPTKKSNYVWILCAQPCPNLKIQNWIGSPQNTHMVISFVRSSPLDVAVERSQPVGSFLLFFKFRFNVKTIVQITALANDRFWFTAHVIRARWTVHLSSPCPHNSGCVNNWLQPYPLIPFSHICPFNDINPYDIATYTISDIWVIFM